jgi:hypothetical protein
LEAAKVAERERLSKVGGLLKPAELEDDELWLEEELRLEYGTYSTEAAETRLPEKISTSTKNLDGWDLYGLWGAIEYFKPCHTVLGIRLDDLDIQETYFISESCGSDLVAMMITISCGWKLHIVKEELASVFVSGHLLSKKAAFDFISFSTRPGHLVSYQAAALLLTTLFRGKIQRWFCTPLDIWKTSAYRWGGLIGGVVDEYSRREMFWWSDGVEWIDDLMIELMA